MWILGAGLVISGFAFVVLRTFGRIHDRAVTLAAEMTRVLSETLGRYRAHLEQTPLAAVEWSLDRRADLARDLQRRWPGLKVVFMSGYPDDALGRHGVLDDGVELIQKPFTAAVLFDRLRTVLRRPVT